MGKALDFGVQSYCFREFKRNTEVVEKILELGLNKVELCGIHADFRDPSAFKEVVEAYKSKGIEIVSLGVETLTGNEKERTIFECAALAGARHISAHFKVDSFPHAIRRARRFSDEFDVRVGIHCHGGYSFGGQPDVLDHLIQLGSPQVGLCLDTAWCMQIGPYLGKPIEWVKRYSSHIYGIHFKDFTFSPNAQWVDTIVGKGNLDLPAFTQALDEHGFDGMAVIEYEADAQNPVPALKRCVEAMRTAGPA